MIDVDACRWLCFLHAVRGIFVLKSCRWQAIALAVLLAMGSASVSPAADDITGETCTGFKAGLVGSGSVHIADRVADQQTGLSGGFFFDWPFGPRLHYGLSVDFHRLSLSDDTPDFTFARSEWLLDLGVNLKANFVNENSSLGLRPGIGAGFGFLRRIDEAWIASSTYFTLRAFAEIVYFSPGDLMFVLEGGVWYAPSGGDNATDVRIGPLVVLRAGVMF
jgi:hypothetical protein